MYLTSRDHLEARKLKKFSPHHSTRWSKSEVDPEMGNDWNENLKLFRRNWDFENTRPIYGLWIYALTYLPRGVIREPDTFFSITRPLAVRFTWSKAYQWLIMLLQLYCESIGSWLCKKHYLLEDKLPNYVYAYRTLNPSNFCKYALRKLGSRNERIYISSCTGQLCLCYPVSWSTFCSIWIPF